MWTIRPKLMSLPGVANVAIWGQRDKQFQVLVDPDRLRANRISLDAVVRATAEATSLETGGFVDTPNQRLAFQHASAVRQPNDLADALVETRNGAPVRLGDVADVSVVPTPNEIKRENASRRLDITCNVQGRDLGSVAREIEDKVKKIPFEREYHPEFLGEYAARQQSMLRLIALGALALVGIVLLLYVDFQAWRPTAIVGLTIPFALIGGVFAVWISGGVLSLGSLVGFVTVLGIAARNGIMMVRHFRHLELEERMPFGIQLVLRGAEERLSPILMTALTTGLALVPLVIAGNKPGHEIEYPLAVVILGGLVTSTILNLGLVPALYLRFGKSKAAERDVPA